MNFNTLHWKNDSLSIRVSFEFGSNVNDESEQHPENICCQESQLTTEGKSTSTWNSWKMLESQSE
jgi:hypothetical protein